MIDFKVSFERRHMQFDNDNYYHWDKPADRLNSYYCGTGGSTRFDRRNGHEVLFFVNHLFSDFVIEPTIEHYQKMEELIALYLPWWKTSHQSVATWIWDYWHKHKWLLG